MTVKLTDAEKRMEEFEEESKRMLDDLLDKNQTIIKQQKNEYELTKEINALRENMGAVREMVRGEVKAEIDGEVSRLSSMLEKLQREQLLSAEQHKMDVMRLKEETVREQKCQWEVVISELEERLEKCEQERDE